MKSKAYQAAIKFVAACDATDGIDPHSTKFDALTEAEFDASENLAEALLEEYRNQSMVLTALESVTKAVKEGY